MTSAREMARTLLAGRVVPDRGNFVYRYWNDDDELLYVGVTGASLRARNHAHAATALWYPAATRYEWAEYSTELQAAEAEVEAIILERPLYNHDIEKGALAEHATTVRRSRRAEARKQREATQALRFPPGQRAEDERMQAWEAEHRDTETYAVWEHMQDITFAGWGADLDESIERATLLGLRYLAERHLLLVAPTPSAAAEGNELTDADVDAYLFPMAELFTELESVSIIDEPAAAKRSSYRFHGSPLTPERYADLASERFAGETAHVDAITEAVIRKHERGGGRPTWDSTCAQRGRRLLQRADAATYVDEARSVLQFAVVPRAFTD